MYFLQVFLLTGMTIITNCFLLPDRIYVVKTGLHTKNVLSVRGIPMVSETVMFECTGTLNPLEVATVRWYINNIEISSARYDNVTADSLSSALLLQYHWETKFKPNMRVKCSIAMSEPKHVAAIFSQDFFAGIIAHGPHQLVRVGDIIRVPVKMTIPVGCSYPTDARPLIMNSIKNVFCGINILLSRPSYQIDPRFINPDTTFKSERCGISFNRNDFNREQNITIAVVQNGTIYDKFNIYHLRFYRNTKRMGTEISELFIWNDFMLPEMSILVLYKDMSAAKIKRTCELQDKNGVNVLTFDGKLIQFTNVGGNEYVVYKHKRLSVEVHLYYTSCLNGKDCICGVSVKSASSVFTVRHCSITGKRYMATRICNENDLTTTINGSHFVVSTLTVIVDIQLAIRGSLNSVISIKSSQIDFEMTSGLCGLLDNNPRNDMVMRSGHMSVTNKYSFVSSWRIKSSEDSFFNIHNIPTVTDMTEYCSCEKQSQAYPYNLPGVQCGATLNRIVPHGQTKIHHNCTIIFE